LCTALLNYYSWTTQSLYLDNWQWNINVLNWEDSSFLLDSDFFFLFNLFNDFFLSNFFAFFLNNYVSFFDYLILNFYSLEAGQSTLHTSFIFDFYIYVNTLYAHLIPFFFNYTHDYTLIYILNSFDFSSLLFDFFLYLEHFSFNSSVSILYDSFFLAPGFSYFDFIVYLKWFVLFFLFFFLFLSFSRFRKLSNLVDFFVTRLYFFLISLGFENRIQLDLVIIFLTFVFFVWIIVLIAFDDIFSEVVELFHMFLILIFLTVIVYLLYKYSLHYFAFLENSVSDGFSTSFISKQMVRDLSNTFALFLRFFLLLFRLNIYDGLDDFLDSYYIFFCDFDEDSYFDESVFHSNTFFYFKDNQEDNIFFQPNEQDWFDDLFSRYFVIWGKLFLFYFFILEEAFRVSLALYIFYLVIFEVHSVNLSYTEDSFFSSKRN
jgi:hypothetical protein